MKPAVLLGLSIVVGLAAALWGGSSTQAEKTEVYWLSSWDKITPSAAPVYQARPTPISLCMARHEYEGFQLVLKNSSSAQVTLQLGPWSGSSKMAFVPIVSFFQELFLNVTRPTDAQSIPGEYPDPLLPISGPVTVQPGLNVFYLEIFAPDTLAPGDYQTTVRMITEQKSWEFILQVHVWPFRLPASTSLKTAIGLDFDSIVAKEKVTAPEADWEKYFRPYYELLADHRLSPISVFAHPKFTVQNGFKTDFSSCAATWKYCYDVLGFNTLRVPFDEAWPINTQRSPLFSEAYNQQAIAYLRSVAEYLDAQGWLERAYVYVVTVDEPATTAEYQKTRQFYHLVKQADPRLLYRHGEQINFNKNNIKWCDIVDINLLAFMRNQQGFQGLKSKQLGWYTAVGPKGNYPNFFLDRRALEHRILPWFNYFYNIPRMLYWNATWWRGVDDPYIDPLTYAPTEDLFANGDGSLCYPGGPKQRIRPVPSLRLKTIRDGLEDYEYFKLSENYFGRPAVMDRLKRCMTDLQHFSRDEKQLAAFRNEIGDWLEKAWEVNKHGRDR